MVSPTVNYSTAYIPASTQSKPTSSNETSPTTASQHINDGALANATVTPFTAASTPLTNSYTPVVSPINGQHASTSDATSRTISQTSTRTITKGTKNKSTESHLASCNVTQLCSNNSAYFWMFISVQVIQNIKTEKDLKTFVSGVFACDSNTGDGKTGDLCQGDRRLQKINVSCSVKNNTRNSNCSILLQLSHAMTTCELQNAVTSALLKADTEQIKARLIGYVERVASPIQCEDAEPSSGEFLRCTSPSSLEDICQSRNTSRVSCVVSELSSTPRPQVGTGPCRQERPDFCNCTAFCNSASRFFIVKIKIASSDFNETSLQTLLSNVKDQCEKMLKSLCQKYNDVLKQYKALRLECQMTQQRCMVVLEMSGGVDVCSLTNLIHQLIDENGNITREGSLSPLVVCGDPKPSVSELMTSNLTWVDKNLLLSDVCNSDESGFKCEANQTLAVVLTNICSEPVPTNPVTPQLSTVASNNPTTTAKDTTPSTTNTNTTQQTNTTSQGAPTAGLPLVGLNSTATTQPAFHTSSGSITVTAPTQDNATQVGLTAINSTRSSNTTSVEHLTLQITTSPQTNSTPNTPTSPAKTTVYNATITTSNNSTITTNATGSAVTLSPNSTTVKNISTTGMNLQTTTSNSVLSTSPQHTTPYTVTTATAEQHNSSVTTYNTTFITFTPSPNVTNDHNITSITQQSVSNITFNTSMSLPNNVTTAGTFTLFPSNTMTHNITTVTQPLQSNTTLSTIAPHPDNKTLNSTSKPQNITTTSNTTASTFTTSPNNTTEGITSTTVYPNTTQSVNISSTVTSETQQIIISSNITTLPITATQVNKTFSNVTTSPDNSTVDTITSVTLVPVTNHTTQDTTMSVMIITAINNNDSSSSTPATSTKLSISLSTTVHSTKNISQTSKGPAFASTTAAEEDTSSGQTPATNKSTTSIHHPHPPQTNPATDGSFLITTTPQKTTSTSQTETANGQTELEAQLDEFLTLTEDVSRLTSSEIKQVVTQLEKLLKTPPVSQEVGQKIIDIVSNLLGADQSVLASSSNRLIQLVDDVGLKLAVTGSRVRRDSEGGPVVLSSNSLVLAVKPVDATNFPTTSVQIFNVDDVQIESFARLQRRSAHSPLASAVLPSSLIDGLSPEEQLQASRVQFTFYSNNILFTDDELNNQTLVSSVLSCTVANLPIQNVTKNIHFTIRNANPENHEASCVFWDFRLNGGRGGWSSDGCFVLNTTMDDTTCSCNHLTAFAILLDLSRGGIGDRTQALILTFITYIGCGISAIFLSVTLLTYLCFQKLLRDIPSKILVQLCLSLLFLNLIFLLDGWLALYPATGLCISTAFFLHYFLLTSFTWVGLEAVHMYMSIVQVFTNYLNRYMLKLSLVGWGVPLIVVIIVIAVDKDNYGLVTYGRFRDGTSDDFCWLRNDIAFYVGLVAYFLAVFALCLVVFIIVLVQLNRIKKQNPQNQSPNRGVMTDMRSICGLVVLLGLTWGFALFAWGPLYLPFVYLFTIFNSLQGFFIFVFHCAIKKTVRRQWRTHLCCGKLWLPENSEWSRTATQKCTNRATVTPPTSAPNITSRSFSFTSNDTNSSGSVFADSGISEGSNSDVVLNELHRRGMPPQGEP
ncbi:adhesion G-protein coupled receptor G2 isoform X2 [Thalassophryne amazonica]|uniref:adhesion G-protein coupled receptor G2 isoform X2 n=1 Tax=Thalassophryne amazonica TaxID=390379 RepID=UPI0014717A1C|nr:adhesion G-protein coupled receptor G2 isoform X2 [Thalassophryne amazonica]